MSNENRWIDYSGLINKTIKEYVSKVQLHPYNFLSEGDVQCALFMMLSNHKEISDLKKTIDGKRISPLHSEVSYFNDRGKLSFHVDLSIIDPETTNVYSERKKIEIIYAKEYRAGLCYAAIEIKFNKRYSKNEILKQWKKDWIKLDDISTRNDLLTCYSILHDKRNHFSKKEEIIPYSRQFPRVKIVYTNFKRDCFFLNF